MSTRMTVTQAAPRLIVTAHFTVPHVLLGKPPERRIYTYLGMPIRDNPFDAWVDRMLYGNSVERINEL